MSLIDPVHELGDQPAVRVGGRALGYGQLRAAAGAVAADLGGARRVAVWAEPTLETCVAVTAAVAAGIELVPLNPSLGSSELEHVLRDSAPDLVVGGPGTVRVDVGRSGPELPRAGGGDEAIALIVYTSGTTGPPKGALLSRRALAANLDALARVWEWTTEDRLVHALPLFHVHGLVLGLLGPLRLGGSLHHLGRFDPAALAAALADGATMAFGVPTMYHRLARAGAADPGVAAGLRAARLLVSGSAPLAAPDFEAIERLSGQRIAERYGLTETLIVTAAGAGDERRPGHVGRALPGVEVRLLGDEAMGEVAVRGPGMFSGYLNRPEATEAVRDGWFMTGDMATAAPDGQLRIVGRRSQDLIKTAGYKVGAGEVEQALLAHPGVAEAAVTGEDDPDLGQRIVAWVVPHGGGPAPAGLDDHVAGLLAPHKRPREVRALEELPRNAMGKVLKGRLGQG